MRAPVSVVIAALNAEDILPLQLSALGEALAEGLIRELIVVDRGSRDATLEIAEAAGAEILHVEYPHAAALAIGVERASGEWLLLPGLRTVPAPGWTDGLWRHLERAQGKAGRLPARPAAPGFWRWLGPGRAWKLLPRTLAAGKASAMGAGV